MTNITGQREYYQESSEWSIIFLKTLSETLSKKGKKMADDGLPPPIRLMNFISENQVLYTCIYILFLYIFIDPSFDFSRTLIKFCKVWSFDIFEWWVQLEEAKRTRGARLEDGTAQRDRPLFEVYIFLTVFLIFSNPLFLLFFKIYCFC